MNTLMAKTLMIASLLTASSLCAAAGPYVAGGIGQQNWEDDIENSTSFELTGGYQFTPNFAAELSYLNSGTSENDFAEGNIDATLSGFALNAVGTLPINDEFSIYGKLGLYSWELNTDIHSNFNGASASFDTDGTDLVWGVGAAYNINQNLSLYTEYRAFEIEISDPEDNSTGKVDFSNISLGVKYQF